MNFLQLECFLSVVKNLNFTEAANNMFLSQSSISKHIMSLEKELGIKLFKRNTRAVSLTIAGEEFREHAITLIEEYYITLRKINSYRNLYSLNVGSIDHLRKIGLTTPIATFLEKFPHININLEQNDTIKLMNLLMCCKIDVAIIAYIIYPFSDQTNISEYSFENYDLYTIIEDEYYLAVNSEHRLANRERVDWTELNGEKLIILDNSFSSNKVIKDTLKHSKAHVKIAFESKQVDTILGLINENFGVALLSKRVVIGNPNITTVSMKMPIKRNTVIIAPKKELRSEVCNCFINHILEFCNHK